MSRLLLLVSFAAAHFGGGTISWVKGEGNSVTFTIGAVWRRSYEGNYQQYRTVSEAGNADYHKSTGTGADELPVTGDVIKMNGLATPTFHAGDGKHYYLDATVAAYSAAEDWIYTHTTITHHYDTPSNQGSSWTASFKGCCRMGEYDSFQNNQDSSWDLQSHVNLLTEEYSIRANTLPIIAVAGKPAVKESEGGKQTDAFFFVGGTNANNEGAISWRMMTAAEMGAGQPHVNPEHDNNNDNPPNVSIDSSNGMVTFRTSGRAPGFWNVGVMMIAGHAVTPLEFLVHVVPPPAASTEGAATVYYAPPLIQNVDAAMEPMANAPLEILSGLKVGEELVFYLVAENDPAYYGQGLQTPRRIGFTWSYLPEGAKLSVVQGDTSFAKADDGGGLVYGYAGQKFSWTAQASQIGQNIFCWEAADDLGVASTQQCLNVEVSA